MAGNSEFDAFIAEEVKKYKDIFVPVKATATERLFVTKLDCRKLHPNPADEFCDPEIGPNYEIISNYVKEYLLPVPPKKLEDPLQIEKIRPDGYLILNGHHRWAAAMKAGKKKLPVHIVNLTQETDINKMLRKAASDRRVTLDLDESVFCAADDPSAEPALKTRFRKLFRERIRWGAPALMHYLTTQGYDIWVYTSNYYSFDYIREYFRRYSVNLTGIITGSSRKRIGHESAKKRIEQKMAKQYAETIHIDSRMLLRTGRNIKVFEEYSLDCDPIDWSARAMSALRELDEGRA